MSTQGPVAEGPDDLPLRDSRPVILLGRGGGGTRLLSEFVQGQGVFLGTEINKSFDSVEWVDTIYPVAIEMLSAAVPPDATRRREHVARLHARAAEVLARAGLDARAYWGWKLPETTLICDIAKEAFPTAQFVHLVRHPVRASLRRTHMTSRMNNPIGRAALPAAYAHLGRDPALIETDSPVIHNAHGWRHHVDLMARCFDGDPALHVVRFEDTVARPSDTAAALAAFLHRAPPPNSPPLAADPERAVPVTLDPDDAHRVWDICGTRAESFGYTLAEVLD